MKNKKDIIKIRKASLQDLDQLINLKILYEKEESQFSPKNDFWRMKINKVALKKDIIEDLKSTGGFFVAENSFGELIGFSTAFMETNLELRKIKKV